VDIPNRTNKKLSLYLGNFLTFTIHFYMARQLHFLILSFFLVLSTTVISVAQNLRSDHIFGEFLERPSTEYRTASGKHGPKYCQNEADYQIEVQLDTTNHTFTGSVTIEYLNNSPEELEFVWLHLEQNRFTPHSRGTLTTPVQGNRYSGNVDGGFERSEEHTSELQSRENLVCRLLLEKKKKI